MKYVRHIRNSSVDNISIRNRWAGCFPASSNVLAADGRSVPISSLSVGDHLLTYDIGRHQLRPSPVIAFLHRDPNASPDLITVKYTLAICCSLQSSASLAVHQNRYLSHKLCHCSSAPVEQPCPFDSHSSFQAASTCTSSSLRITPNHLVYRRRPSAANSPCAQRPMVPARTNRSVRTTRRTTACLACCWGDRAGHEVIYAYQLRAGDLIELVATTTSNLTLWRESEWPEH
ncbi:unnamed protein product, partial [Protopolystoma xenopodis]